jgi:hypothetical protein
MRYLLVALIVASAGLLSGPADARLRDQQETQQERQQRREQRREHFRDRQAEAARRAQLRNGGGRVLSVEPEGAGHRVKVLKDGEVRVLHVEDD